MAITLNPNILQEQKVTPEAEEMILHVFNQLKHCLENPDTSFPEKTVEKVEALEYTLQWLFNFPQDRNKHKYWYRIVGCTCPKLDNADRFGTPYRVINKNCPFHGEV